MSELDFQYDIVIVDYRNPQQGMDLIALLDHYARDPMGGGKPLPKSVKENLVAELARLPHAFSVMIYSADQPVALINCFETFSTFKAKPLINIHDVVVHRNYRGKGLSRKLFEKVEEIARGRGCCKLTLEVLEGNRSAQKAYLAFGFDGYQLDPDTGKALFWQKELK